MKLVINREINNDKWVKLLGESDFSSPFQTPSFYNLIKNTLNFDADIFAVGIEDSYEALVVVTKQKETGVKAYFSRRAIVYGGILFKKNVKALNYLLSSVVNYYKKKVIYLEIRNNFDYSKYIQTFENNGLIFNEHLNVILPFEDIITTEDILSKMKYNKRREIRLSIKEEANFYEAKSEQEVVELFKLLEDLYKNRVKLPLFPLSFFLDLFKSQIGKIFVVKHNDKIIGGSFNVFHEKMSINTLYYVGDRNYHKKIFPTHLAILGAIEFGITNNLTHLDFMGAGKPDIDYGVREYKLSFGGEVLKHGRFNIVLSPILYKIGLFGLKVLKRLS